MDENTLIQQAYGTDQQSLYNYLGQLADAFFNTQQQLVSDATYDRLVDIYEQRFGEYTRVGAPPRGEKEALSVYRSGMRKVTDENGLRLYIKNYPGPWLLLDKINGLNLQYTLTITNGIRNEKLTTRGDGTEGKNVTHLLPYLNIPRLEFDIDVIGELYTPTEAFNRVGASFGYTSALGMTVGITNGKDSFNPEQAKELRYGAFEVVKSTETPEVQIIQLTMVGFKTPHAVKANELSIEFLENFYQQRKAAAEYDMDGIVIRQNRYVAPSQVQEIPRHVVAFKMDGVSIETTVTEVVWVASKWKLLGGPRY